MTETTVAEPTQAMIEAGMIAARRGGLGPVATYEQFLRFKEGIIAAYRAMRALESQTEPQSSWDDPVSLCPFDGTERISVPGKAGEHR